MTALAAKNEACPSPRERGEGKARRPAPGLAARPVYTRTTSTEQRAWRTTVLALEPIR